MFVWKDNGHNLAIWNPKLTWATRKQESKEGCLSFPGVQVIIRRATKVTMSGSDSRGFPENKPRSIFSPIPEGITVFGNPITSRIWQHEIDHLDGKLIIDNMNRADTIANRDALKTLLNNHRGRTK
jgi:peptide deformylase